MFPFGDRVGLAAAFIGCVVVTLPWAVAPTVVVRGGFDFNRVEDVAHAGATALVVVTLALLRRRPPTSHTLALAAAATMAAAVGAELAQLGAPGRSAAAADLGWDLVGVVLGVALVAWPRMQVRLLRRVTTVMLAAIGVAAVVLLQPV